MNLMRSVLFIFAGILGISFAEARVLKIAAASSRAPYIIAEDESGIELDILRAIVKRMGYDVKFTFTASLDLPGLVGNKDIDGINSIYDIKTVPLYYSDPDISYSNRAISLKERKISIKTIEDLSKYSIAAFANAKFSFGEEFKKVAERNKSYTEYKDQSIQPKLLYSGRVDVVISDVNMFRYHCRELKNVEKMAVSYDNILKETFYSVAFKEPGLRDEFNKALLSIKKDGSYQKILDRYKESLVLD